MSHPVRTVAILFVATRVVIGAAMVLSLTLLARSQCECPEVSANHFLSALANWDGQAYVTIARDGYQGSDPSYVAFFPLYPALMRAIGSAGGGGVDALIVAGVLIANAACLAAGLLLLRIDADDAQGAGAAAALLTFPTTVFLSAVYADSLFIALALGSAIAAQRSRWWTAGGLASLAALTRPFGVLAAVPLTIALWRARRSLAATSLLSLLIAPIALGAWLAYLFVLTGDPLALVHGYAAGFTPRGPLHSVTDLFDQSSYGFPWFVGAFFILFWLLVVRCWRVTNAGLAAYATLMMVLITVAGSLTSSLRYELSVYPAFVALAGLFRMRVARVVWTAVGLLLACVFAGMFALYYWVG